MSRIKNKHFMFALAASVGLILMAGAGFWMVDAHAANQSMGSITYVKGDASLAAHKSNNWKPAKLQTRIYQGDKLKTREGSRLEATMKDGSKIRLAGGSEINLEKLKTNANKKTKKRFSAKLLVGRVWASVSKIFGGDSKFEVSTSNAVCGVRGTTFQTSMGADGTTTVKVYSGKVLVSNEPIYAVKGHTKENRVEVAGPAEVSQKKWEELVAGAMQMITVAANGDMTPPQEFAKADPAEDDWEAWNAERDKLASLE